MHQVGIVAAIVLILIYVPCDGDSSDTPADNASPGPETPATPPETRIFPRGANDDSITYNVGDPTYVSLWDRPIYYPLNNGESMEEQQWYTYNVPSTVNFQDIYSNNLALLAEEPAGSTIKTESERIKEAEPTLTTPKDDESFHLSNVHTQFVEFHPKTQTIPPRTIPPPMFPPNVTYVKNEMENTTTTTTTTTTEEPDDLSIEVIPIKKENYQRGVLDLLFPAARVKTFKSVFDTFRRIMSHTFR